MKVTFKTGSEANYGSTNGELFFASNTKQIMLNGIKYIPKKLSELTNDSGFITSITKSMVEGVLTGNITSHTHSYLPLTGGTLTGNLTCNDTIIATSFNGSLNGTAANASKLATHSVTDLVYRTIYPTNATGVLIETDIAAASNTMVNVHIWGNSYLKTTPIDTYIQFYNYKNEDTIINCGCTHLGYNLGDVYVFIYKSLVHIWFDASGTGYPTINAFVGTNEGGDISGTYNHITSLTKGSKPTSGISREKVITPKVNAFTDSNVASATKLETPRKITIGSTSKSFDGSGDIEFALNSIITQSDTINVGTINLASDATINGALMVGGDISGELSNKLSITLGSTTTTYDNTDNKSINITPSTIGAATASHTHSYLPLTGGTMSSTNLVTNLNADLLDGLNSSDFVRNKNITSTSSASIDANNVWVNAVKHDYRWENVPNNDIASLLDLSYSPDWRTQLFFQPASTLKIFARARYSGTTWGAWREIAFTDSNVAAASKWATARTITLTGSVTGSVSIDGSQNVSLDTTTSHTHSEYLPLTGGTLNGALTVPTLTSTGGIMLGIESINGSLGIKKYNEGFIGFSYILGGVNGSVPFEGISLGWGSSPETSANSVRINASTFTYKGNNVWHSGNLKLGYISSGLSRAVQKDSSNNLYVVAPSLFEQGISNNYPKNLRWITDDEGQLVFDTEETAGVPSTVQVGIPVAHETSKGFMKSISTVTNVTGYTPCPVVSGTPYYKLDTIELDYNDFLEIGSGSIESNLPITIKVQEGGSLKYLFDYTVDNIPRLLTISEGNFCKYFFWLQQTDDDTHIVAYYHCQFNDLWLVIDSPNMEVRISQGSF